MAEATESATDGAGEEERCDGLRRPSADAYERLLRALLGVGGDQSSALVTSTRGSASGQRVVWWWSLTPQMPHFAGLGHSAPVPW